MSEALIGGICTVLSAIVTVIVTDLLNKKREKENQDLIKNLNLENISLKAKVKEISDLLPKNFEIIKDVDDVLHKKILPIIASESSNHRKIVIQNFGLDLHSVMPWMENKIIHSEEFDNTHIEIKSLIMNPNSIHIKDYIDGRSNISSQIIRSSIAIGNDFNNHEDLDRFCLEIRQYDLPPIFHGFLLNDEHLFLGFTEIYDGKIIGGTKPYLHLWRGSNADSVFNSHYFRFYKDWFEYYWKISKEVANVRK